MTGDSRSALLENLAAAEADVTRLRTDNGALADAFRADPTEERREELRRAAASLSEARDRVVKAKSALAVFDATGSRHGVVASSGQVSGSIVLAIPPGTGQDVRTRLVDEALGQRLAELAEELGVVLTTSPSRFVRERPGRDEEGRTILDVAGRVEGDYLVPAVSRAARLRR